MAVSASSMAAARLEVLRSKATFASEESKLVGASPAPDVKEKEVMSSLGASPASWGSDGVWVGMESDRGCPSGCTAEKIGTVESLVPKRKGNSADSADTSGPQMGAAPKLVGRGVSGRLSKIGLEAKSGTSGCMGVVSGGTRRVEGRPPNQGPLESRCRMLERVRMGEEGVVKWVEGVEGADSGKGVCMAADDASYECWTLT